MDFTREPIIETIITPREGCKLVVKNSKTTGQEEFFVDAIEVVSFGKALFFRSLEKPKPFLVPISDYEVLEVREARMVLKTSGPERAIKIGGGRETAQRSPKELDKVEEAPKEISTSPVDETGADGQVTGDRGVKKRERRRQYRSKRKGQDDESQDLSSETSSEGRDPSDTVQVDERKKENSLAPVSSAALSALLAPPPMLISETISRYRESSSFQGAFFLTEEEEYKPHDKVKELLNEDEEEKPPHLTEPTFDSSETQDSQQVLAEGNQSLIEENQEVIEEGNQAKELSLESEKEQVENSDAEKSKVTTMDDAAPL